MSTISPSRSCNSCALVSPAGLLTPREHDSDSPVALLESVDAQVVIAVSVSPLDLCPEDLTGLRGTCSGRRPLPKTPGAPTAPLHLRVHQRDQRLDVARAERLVRSPDRVGAHAAWLFLAGSRPPPLSLGVLNRGHGGASFARGPACLEPALVRQVIESNLAGATAIAEHWYELLTSP
jgi:hypothetical protein